VVSGHDHRPETGIGLQFVQHRPQPRGQIESHEIQGRVVEAQDRDRSSLDFDQGTHEVGSPNSRASPIGASRNSRAGMVLRFGLTAGLKSMCANTSRSGSMPGASSIKVRRCSSREKTALSVMYLTCCPRRWAISAEKLI